MRGARLKVTDYSKDNLEFEVKFLGSKEDLERVINQIVNEANTVPRVVEYVFKTTYYDVNSEFKDSGFSLRSRDKGCGWDPSFEIKELEGLDRIEVTVRGETPVKAYFNLVAQQKDLPDHIPRVPKRLKDLETIGEIETHRVQIDTLFDGHNVEVCLDFVTFPSGHQEYELELEFTDIPLNVFKDVAKSVTMFVEKHAPNVVQTKESKALRAFKTLNP